MDRHLFDKRSTVAETNAGPSKRKASQSSDQEAYPTIGTAGFDASSSKGQRRRRRHSSLRRSKPLVLPSYKYDHHHPRPPCFLIPNQRQNG